MSWTLPRLRRYAMTALLGLVIGTITAPSADAGSENWINPRYLAGQGAPGFVSSPTHVSQAGANSYLISWTPYPAEPVGHSGTVAWYPGYTYETTGIKYSGYDLKDPRDSSNWACYGCTNSYWRVRNAQWLLVWFGYMSSGSVDGYWGSSTWLKVCTFQYWSGLTRDGFVGLNTWTELNTTGVHKPNPQHITYTCTS